MFLVSIYLVSSNSCNTSTCRQVILNIRRHSKDGISLEEIYRLQIKGRRHSRHYRIIFLTWNVVKAHRVPQHNVFVLDRSISAIR